MIRKILFIVLAVMAFGSVAPAQTNEPRLGSGIGPNRFGRTAGSVPIIKSKPEPQRPNHLPNQPTTIVLSAVFTSDGLVTGLKFVKVIPEGLPRDELKDLVRLAKAAAREIKFEPAVKDGRPVSMYMRLEYAFAPGAEDTTPSKPGN